MPARAAGPFERASRSEAAESRAGILELVAISSAPHRGDPPPSRAALYVRVSGPRQDPASQLAEVRKFISARSWQLAGEYVEVIPVWHPDRPEFHRLLQDAFRHEFDVVVVLELSRFGRSLEELVVSLAHLRELGIRFCSVHESFDSETPGGKLQMVVFAWLAKYENAQRRERVILGQAAAKARGQHVGRYPQMIDEAKVRADYQVLRSTRKVAVLHRCSPRTISRVLHRARELKWQGQTKPA